MVPAQRVALLHRRVLSPMACVRAFHAPARARLSCNRGASAARRTAAQLREFARANWHIELKGKSTRHTRTGRQGGPTQAHSLAPPVAEESTPSSTVARDFPTHSAT